jgi:hypothetical protein
MGNPSRSAPAGFPGLLALALAAVASAVLPPLPTGGSLPSAPVTKLNAVFIVVALAVMVVVTATLGIGAALIAVVVLLGWFWLGQLSQKPESDD